MARSRWWVGFTLVTVRGKFEKLACCDQTSRGSFVLGRFVQSQLFSENSLSSLRGGGGGITSTNFFDFFATGSLASGAMASSISSSQSVSSTLGLSEHLVRAQCFSSGSDFSSTSASSLVHTSISVMGFIK